MPLWKPEPRVKSDAGSLLAPKWRTKDESWYASSDMAPSTCLISCRDLAGTEHAVEVTAESLYEAVAQALGILRGDIWVEEIGEGLTELKVRVRQPAIEHRVQMKDFRRWLESQCKTPAECTRKHES